jgi:2-methylisocitrate lyase-like PEP mutase family enzyme
MDQEKTMADQTRKAEQFRGLHLPGKPLILFNIWDAGSTKVVATSGAKAIATGSWSVAGANGFADGERIPLALAIDNLRRIVGATDLPVTIDLDGGYGDTSAIVGETIDLAINAGAVGCNREDSFPGKAPRDSRSGRSHPACSADGRCSQSPLLHQCSDRHLFSATARRT